MSVVETILIFAGIPAAFISLVAIAVWGRSTVHQPSRYRPGKPWTYPPVWYLPRPEGAPAASVSAGKHHVMEAAIDAAAHAPALAAKQAAKTTATGGASGEW